MTRDKQVLYQTVKQIDVNVVGTQDPTLANEDPERRAGEIVYQLLKDKVDSSTPRALLYLYESNFWYYIDDLWKVYVESLHSTEVGEFPQAADYTIMNLTGDCEDIARAQYFIAEAFGFTPYMLVFLAKTPQTGDILGHAVNSYITSSRVYIHDFNRMFEFPKKSTNDIENIFYAMSGYFDYMNLDPFSLVIITFKPWAGYDKRMSVEDGFYININGGDQDSYRGTNLYFPQAKNEMIVYSVPWLQNSGSTSGSNFFEFLKTDPTLQAMMVVFGVLIVILLFKN
jgi:hypothetical protein